MSTAITEAEQNLALLKSLIPSGESFHIWCYTNEGKLLGCSCGGVIRETLHHAFQALGAFDKMLKYAAAPDHDEPRILGSSIGIQWAVTLEKERRDSVVFVLGPVANMPLDGKSIRSALIVSHPSGNDISWIESLCAFVPALPVMSYAVFTRYVMMVHNVLTDQQLGLDAIRAAPAAPAEQAPTLGERDRNKVYLSERAMLRMVRNGDIHYQRAMQSSILLSPGVPVQGRDPLRQAKTSVIVFTTLVTRAAIEGGLSPELAYPLGDSYIQAAEDCRDSGELNALAHAMYHDFVYRVHHLHVNPNYSHAIQKCCDYIELSLDRKIRTADLAALVGYTEYYLTEKFKKETGQSVSSYIRYAKVERAKVLLESTELSVREIAERLAFNTVNYFIQSFRDTTGYSPAQYRKKFKAQ